MTNLQSVQLAGVDAARPERRSTRVHGRAMIAVLCMAIFVGATSWFAPFVLMPFMANDLGTDVSLLGRIESGTILVAAVLALVTGSLIRRYGYRQLYLLGVVTMAVGSATIAVAPGLPLVLVGMLLLSLANAIITPVSLAMATTELAGDTRRRAMSYQIACLFAAVAVGLPVDVLVANSIGWHGSFAVLAAVPALLLVAVLRLIPVGQREPSSRVNLVDAVGRYGQLLRDRSLVVLYVFWVLYVMCAFGSAAFSAALIVWRGFGADAVSLLLACVGVAFIISSVITPEVLGRRHVDLRWLAAVVAILFFLARAVAFLLPVPLIGLMGLFALASVMDGCMGVVMRSLIAGYEVPEQALSMVFFETCGSLGQAGGGLLAGTALAIGGYPAIGMAMLLLCLLASGLPIVSGRIAKLST